jgi:hypothetical protein
VGSGTRPTQKKFKKKKKKNLCLGKKVRQQIFSTSSFVVVGSGIKPVRNTGLKLLGTGLRLPAEGICGNVSRFAFLSCLTEILVE